MKQLRGKAVNTSQTRVLHLNTTLSEMPEVMKLLKYAQHSGTLLVNKGNNIFILLS